MDEVKSVPDKMTIRYALAKRLREVQALKAILKAIERYERESVATVKSIGGKV